MIIENLKSTIAANIYPHVRAIEIYIANNNLQLNDFSDIEAAVTDMSEQAAIYNNIFNRHLNLQQHLTVLRDFFNGSQAHFNEPLNFNITALDIRDTFYCVFNIACRIIKSRLFPQQMNPVQQAVQQQVNSAQQVGQPVQPQQHYVSYVKNEIESGVIDAITSPIQMIFHPVDTVVNTANMIVHPIDTLSNVGTFIWQHPWRFGASLLTGYGVSQATRFVTQKITNSIWSEVSKESQIAAQELQVLQEEASKAQQSVTIAQEASETAKIVENTSKLEAAKIAKQSAKHLTTDHHISFGGLYSRRLIKHWTEKGINVPVSALEDSLLKNAPSLTAASIETVSTQTQKSIEVAQLAKDASSAATQALQMGQTKIAARMAKIAQNAKALEELINNAKNGVDSYNAIANAEKLLAEALHTNEPHLEHEEWNDLLQQLCALEHPELEVRLNDNMRGTSIRESIRFTTFNNNNNNNNTDTLHNDAVSNEWDSEFFNALSANNG